MKILIVLPTAIMGGAERVMFNLASYLLDRGDELLLYVMSRGAQDGWAEIASHPNCKAVFKEYKSEKTSLFSFMVSIFLISRKNKIDLVLSTHTHINASLSFFRKIKILICGKLVARESTFIFERFDGWRRCVFNFMYRYLYGEQDLLIVQTKKMGQSLSASLGFSPAKRVECIPNPVNSNFIDKKKEESIFLPKIMQKKEARIICMAGRLVPIKNISAAVEAYSEVSKKYADVYMLILGDGPERDNLEKLASSLGVEGKLCFMGRVANPYAYFSISQIGILSSHKEGFPNVLIEMMASGTKQIITTPCTDGVYDLPGVSVTKDSTAYSISEALFSCLNNSADLSKEFRGYIDSRRSVEKYWERMLSLV